IEYPTIGARTIPLEDGLTEPLDFGMRERTLRKGSSAIASSVENQIANRVPELRCGISRITSHTSVASKVPSATEVKIPCTAKGTTPEIRTAAVIITSPPESARAGVGAPRSQCSCPQEC